MRDSCRRSRGRRRPASDTALRSRQPCGKVSPEAFMGESVELKPGTLDLFILRALADDPLHGYAIVAWLRRASNEQLGIEEGALYHALHRMERRGWLRAEWGASANNRQARFYRLTAAGRRQLARETLTWQRYADLADRILQPKRNAHEHE